MSAEPTSQTTLTPHNQQPLVTKTYPSEGELEQIIQKAAAAQEKWARVPLQQRIAIGRAFMVRLLRGLNYASVLDQSPLHRKSLGRCVMISRWN